MEEPHACSHRDSGVLLIDLRDGSPHRVKETTQRGFLGGGGVCAGAGEGAGALDSGWPPIRKVAGESAAR